MRRASRETPQISRQRANVRAAAAGDARGQARVVAGEYFPAMNDDACRSENDLLAAGPKTLLGNRKCGCVVALP